MVTEKIMSVIGRTLFNPLSAALLAASFLVACSSHDKPTLKLDVAEPKAEPTADEWVRRQQMIHVTIKNNDGVVEYDRNPLDVAGNIEQNCYVMTSRGVPDVACDGSLVEVMSKVCAARGILAVVNSQSSPTVFPFEDSELNCPHVSNGPAPCNLTIDPVSEGAAAGLSQFATYYARDAIDYALSRLAPTSHPSYCTNAAGQWILGVDGTQLAPRFATALADAYYLGIEAYKRAVEATLNASDLARSSSLSPEASHQRSFVGSALSRVAAAHLLAGGEQGLLGSTSNSLCVGPELAPAAQTALKLLRSAGVPLSLVADTALDTETLVNGPLGTDPLSGSVRERLAQFHQIQEFQGAGTKTVQEYYDLTIADFDAARSYLNQETRAFARSVQAMLPSDPDNPSGYRKSVASAEPKSLPPGAWSARARYQTSAQEWGVFPPGAAISLGNFPLEMGLDAYIGNVHSAIRETLWNTSRNYTSPGGNATSVTKGVLGPLANIVSSGEYHGVVGLDVVSGNRLYLSAFGYSEADAVRVVLGEDGLRCALEGNIEGAPCELGPSNATFPCPAGDPNLGCLTIATLGDEGSRPSSDAASYSYGTSTWVSATPTLTSGLISALRSNQDRLYWVRPKDPASPLPGQFELLVGGVLTSVGQVIPIVPSVDERVASAFAPNRKYCAVPETSCANVTMDARLPLEDELTDDSNGIENSWRHYLTLAHQAADEADLLGRQYQDAQLAVYGDERDTDLRKEENYQRAEEALQQVQDACGTAIDSRRLLKLISTSAPGSCKNGACSKLEAIAGSACNANGTCDDPRYACTGGRCVFDFQNLANLEQSDPALQNDPDMIRLQNCLSEGPAGQRRFTTLGTSPLCVAVSESNPNDVCPGGTQCPTRMVNNACEPGSAGVRMEEAEPLGYFDSPPPPAEDACDLFRRLRKGVPTDQIPDLIGQLKRSDIFSPTGIDQDVGYIEYVAKYGGFVDLKAGGVLRVTTGSIETGQTTGWPCSAHANCEDKEGLYCAPAACATAAARGQMNERLFRVALAANLARGFEPPKLAWGNVVSLSGMRATLPYSMAQNLCLAPDALLLPDLQPPPPNDSAPELEQYTQGGYLLKGPDSTSDGFTSVKGCKWGYAPDLAWTWSSPRALQEPFLLHFYKHDVTDTSGIAWIKADGTIVVGRDGMTFANPIGVTVEPSIPTDRMFFGGLSASESLAFSGGDSDDWVYRVLAGVTSKDDVPAVFSYTVPKLNKLLTPSVIADGRLSGDDLLDGVEFLCELRKTRGAQVSNAPISVTRPEDIAVAGANIRQLADQLKIKASSMIFDGVPPVARDALRTTSAVGAFPALGGRMAQHVSSLRGALLGTRHALPVISGAMAEMGGELESLGARLKIRENEAKVVDLNALGNMLNHVTECADAIGNVAKTYAGHGVVICANAMAQIAIGAETAALQKTNITLERQIDYSNFRTRMSQIAGNIQGASTSLSEAAESIDAAAAAIDALKKEAQRNLAKAVYLASYESEQQAGYTRAIGTLALAEQQRYQVALRNAKLMTDLARRSIEQRLGVRLSEMREPLPLVDAPASWEGDICTMNGLNPAAIAALKDGDTTSWAGGFIGDYVTRLENLIESYRLQNKFHEGSDVAVISLRDDVLNVRAQCPVASPNLFARAATLSDGNRWEATGCKAATVDGVQYPATNCITAKELPSDPVLPRDIPGGATGYSLVFGVNGACSTAACGWQTGAAFTQTLVLKPGTYRLSWYAKRSEFGATASFPRVRPAGASSQIGVFGAGRASGDANSWNRYFAFFKIVTEGSYEVGFAADTTPMPTSVKLAAPMLESVDANTTSGGPGDFVDPGDSTVVASLACEDSSGDVFRFKHWRRECVHQCASGFSTACSEGPEFCYREMSFGLNQRWIQNGKVFNYSGFARGNFNYRIDTLGLNFVGDVRDCANAELPNTCFNAAFVPYSVEHNGPLFVLNHAGAEQRAYLFDGRIEHARGLAAERYLTNPLSSTDHQLIDGYMREEFRGRPLDGQFVIRVWEEPGVDFDAIKDVQLVLNYRYWTRFN
ncbi:MAG: hypothetical protein QM756_04220 [Polyangiaceae bacterium]